MAIIKAFAGALGGTFADLWKDIITAGRFDEYVVVAPGVPRGTNNGRGRTSTVPKASSATVPTFMCPKTRRPSSSPNPASRT